MKKYYFKVQYGYDKDDYLAIEGHELDKAILAHLTGAVVAFEHGSVTGSKIIVIKEDFVRAMGWNRGYVLTPEDQHEIELKCKDYTGLIASAKERVGYLIKTNQTHLVGKEQVVPVGLEKNVNVSSVSKEISDLSKSLADKMKI